MCIIETNDDIERRFKLVNTWRWRGRIKFYRS